MSPLRVYESKYLAFAKINLTLNVTGKRPDGYHELETIMQAVSLCDDVSVRLAPADGAICVTIDTDDDYIAGQCIPVDEQNTAYRAAVEFVRRHLAASATGESGFRFAIDIHIHKRIPAAAGLAGGSADAAAVLRALNDMAEDIRYENGESFGCLSENELLSAALSIGADVPFCLQYGTQRADAGAAVGGTARVGAAASGSANVGAAVGGFANAGDVAGRPARVAYACGIGEIMRPLPHSPPNFTVILANPRKKISTAEIFRKYIFPNAKEIDNLSILAKDMIKSHCRCDDKWDCCYNALENTVTDICPQISQYKSLLLASGASCAVMSGSGPTVYGLFNDFDAARRAASAIRAGGGWAAFCDLI